jgi:chorismate-pyruvate lyase
MNAMLLEAFGVTSTDGVASLMTTLLTASTTPATLLLEELARTTVRIEVLGRADRELTAGEHHRLEAGPITTGHYRSGLLRTAGGLVVAETTLVILPQRLPAAVGTALASTNVPIGKILAPLGMQRTDRRALRLTGALNDAGTDVAVKSSAVLVVNGVKVGIATEKITGDFCRLIARNTPA